MVVRFSKVILEGLVTFFAILDSLRAKLQKLSKSYIDNFAILKNYMTTFQTVLKINDLGNLWIRLEDIRIEEFYL